MSPYHLNIQQTVDTSSNETYKNFVSQKPFFEGPFTNNGQTGY
jgi:hypothetical protein